MPNSLRKLLAAAASLALLDPLTVADACLAHRPNAADLAPAQAKILTPLWVGPAFSGSWYTASRSGEGFIVQVQADGRVTAVWFTYPPAGVAGEQAWIFAQDGVISGDKIRFPTVFTTQGPRFGADFDPAKFQRTDWGTLEFQFSDCNRGTVSYAGPAGWGSGTREIERLSALDELGCAPKQKLTANSARALTGLKQRSAAWFDPSHSGEGWLLEELPDGRAVLYWFTYDGEGRQAWTVGIAPASGDRIEIVDNLRPVGTRFGAGFNAADIRREAWGRVTLSFSGCDSGQLDYQSTQPGFGSGSLRPVRLNRLAGSACLTQAPGSAAGGSWSDGAPMPGPQSETGVGVVGGKILVGGGFGDARGLKRYDPAGNSWTTLARIPGGRDHAVASVFGSQLLYTGGYANGDGDQDNRGWRYLSQEDRWVVEPALPAAVASGGATLNGYAWFASISGTLTQLDPQSGAVRQISGHANGTPRDHSNLVAFQGELWLLGGRRNFFREVAEVSIFDPASESWRAGPAMRAGRSGFAAAASDTHILVAGGELLTSLSVLDVVEAIGAGDDGWSLLPPLPQAVHGVAGAMVPGIDRTFFVLAGSTQAAVAANTGRVQIYRW